jgi:hypothetical protein
VSTRAFAFLEAETVTMKNLNEMDRAELLVEVDRMGIKGVKDKNKDVIREAIQVELARRATEADQGQDAPTAQAPEEPQEPPEGPEGPGDDGTPEEPKGADAAGDGAPMGEPLTAEQRHKLRSASYEQIQTVLEDPTLPVLWRKEFQAELVVRNARKREKAKRDSMTSEIEKWEVTRGGPFVINGRVTQLRTGGVISALTHDLKEVRRQGIELRKLDG